MNCLFYSLPKFNNIAFWRYESKFKLSGNVSIIMRHLQVYTISRTPINWTTEWMDVILLYTSAEHGSRVCNHVSLIVKFIIYTRINNNKRCKDIAQIRSLTFISATREICCCCILAITHEPTILERWYRLCSCWNPRKLH